MTTTELILLLLALQTKHFLLDWAYQPRWMYANKGKFGHPGGIIHAGWQALATIPLLTYIAGTSLEMASEIAFAEFVLHYMMDWTKMNVNMKMGWTPVNSEWFWRWTGFDQFFHQLCYVGIVWLVS